jgi:hypothetical protein
MANRESRASAACPLSAASGSASSRAVGPVHVRGAGDRGIGSGPGGGGAALRRRRGGPAVSFREKRPTSDQRFDKM